MKVSHIVTISLLVVFLLFQSGLLNRLRADSISPKEVQAEIKNGTSILIDVREKDEVVDGMVQGALWISLSKIQAGGDGLAKVLDKLDRTKKLNLYCRSGSRSAKAGSILSKMGFSVRNAGGFSSLVGAGLATTKPSSSELAQ